MRIDIKRRFVYWIGISLLMSCVCTAAFATQVPQLSLADLVENSGAVFVGTVIKADSSDYDIENEKPRTSISLEVVKLFLGDERRLSYNFNLPMGIQKDGSINEWVGAPQFLNGETYLVFARKGDWHITPITNWWHGIFRKENVGGKSVYVNQEGYVVTGFTERGVTVGDRVSLPDSFLIATRERGETSKLVETKTTLGRLSIEHEITEEGLREKIGNCKICMDADMFEQSVSEAVKKYGNKDESLIVLTNPKPVLPVRPKDITSSSYEFEQKVVSDISEDILPTAEDVVQDPQDEIGGSTR